MDWNTGAFPAALLSAVVAPLFGGGRGLKLPLDRRTRTVPVSLLSSEGAWIETAGLPMTWQALASRSSLRRGRGLKPY